jgi:hypothetical protein
MVDEVACEGWKAFCEMTRMSKSKAYRKKKELLHCGAIFYMYRGRPPRRVMMFFPSIIRRWTGVKAAKGEVI